MRENVELVICYRNGGCEMEYNNYIPLEKISISASDPEKACFLQASDELGSQALLVI